MGLKATSLSPIGVSVSSVCRMKAALYRTDSHRLDLRALIDAWLLFAVLIIVGGNPFTLSFSFQGPSPHSALSISAFSSVCNRDIISGTKVS